MRVDRRKKSERVVVAPCKMIILTSIDTMEGQGIVRALVFVVLLLLLLQGKYILKMII